MKEIALEIDAQANESRDMFAMSNSQDQSVIDQQLFSFMECQVPRIQDFLTRFISREAANQLDLVAPGVQTSISMPSANTLNIIIREQENLVDFAEAKERIFDEVQAMQDNEVEDDSDSEISDGTGTQVIGPSGGAENLPREQSDTEDTSATIVIALEGQMRDADLSLVPEEPEASIQSNDQSNTVFSPDQTSNTMAYRHLAVRCFPQNRANGANTLPYPSSPPTLHTCSRPRRDFDPLLRRSALKQHDCRRTEIH
jgi:hypothetical protein